MKKRKSYFLNFSTNSLFLTLKETQKELLKLEINYIECPNYLLKTRINQLKFTISSGIKELVKRYLDDSITLENSAKLLIKATSEIEEIVFSKIFVIKVIEGKELISLDLLTSAIDKLELEELVKLVDLENTYGKLAKENYIEILFNVGKDIKNEIYLKIKKDRMDL